MGNLGKLSLKKKSEGWSYSDKVLAEYMRHPGFDTQYWKEKNVLIGILSFSITQPATTAIFLLTRGVAHGVHSLASV